MVKGVNKTIIEVNNTGSKVFDRIVFYVNPSCSNLSTKHLQRAMQRFTFQFDDITAKHKTIRHKRLIRRRIIIAASGGLLVLTAVMLAIFL